MMKCIACDHSCYVDDLSTIDKFVYRCEVTKKIIDSVGSEGCGKGFRTQGPQDTGE